MNVVKPFRQVGRQASASVTREEQSRTPAQHTFIRGHPLDAKFMRNPEHLFHTDFSACNAYANGQAAAEALRCPALFIFGTRDVMTPARSTRLLTGAIAHGRVVQVDAGHAMMAEQPDAVLDALAAFARTGK